MIDNTGWISLHRRIRSHWIWENPEYLKAWICILLEVNHEKNKVLIEKELIECDTGQSLHSLKSWAKLFGKKWTIHKVRTFFILLENDSMIVREGLRKTSRVTVCNYDSYQKTGQANGRQTAGRRQADGKLTATNNNDNNYNNDNKKKEEEEEEKSQKSQKRFCPPTIEEIDSYVKAKGYKVNAERFFYFYESKGWKVGKNKMKSWKASVATWNTKEESSDCNENDKNRNKYGKSNTNFRAVSPDTAKQQRQAEFTSHIAKKLGIDDQSEIWNSNGDPENF